MRPLEVLIVEDSRVFASDLADEIRLWGKDEVHVSMAATLKSALESLDPPPDVLLLDAILPATEKDKEDGEVDHEAGLRILEHIEKRRLMCDVIMLSGQDKKAAVRLLIRFPAVHDYLFKDTTWKELVARLHSSLGLVMSAHKAATNRVPTIVGQSAVWQKVLALTKKVAPFATTVLLLGESGTGKELLARMTHESSRRSRGPFVALNCAALPAALAESILFGHEKGAFTGAVKSSLGQVASADGGTLFLDEVGELPLDLQAKLLRLWEEREVTPIGGMRARPVNVRVVAATNRDLQQKVDDGEFRDDLYHRLAVFTIELPPLRMRGDDIEALAEHFVEVLSKQMGRRPPHLSAATKALLLHHEWPGNVRELRNVIERALILTREEELTPAHLEPLGAETTLRPSSFSEQSPSLAALFSQPFAKAHAEFERRYLERALAKCNWNVSEVARESGMPRKTLQRRLAQYGLSRPNKGEER